MCEQSPLARASLDEVLEFIWSKLEDGAARATRPFHTGAVATLGSDGPSVRTVVLRRVDRASGRLVFHTDRRSPKFAELQRDDRMGWCFYDRRSKVQIRLRGTAEPHVEGQLADAQWLASSADSRACYRTAVAPGDPAGDEPPGVQAGDGRCNFAVVACAVRHIDWLFLRHEGHRRARFNRGDAGWQGAWIGP